MKQDNAVHDAHIQMGMIILLDLTGTPTGLVPVRVIV